MPTIQQPNKTKIPYQNN